MDEDFNDMLVWRGVKDIEINQYVKLHIPTLNEILDFGEKKYWNCAYNICSTPSDLCCQLYDIGIDFAKADKYEVFVNLIRQGITRETSKLLFGDTLDFSKMIAKENPNTNELILVQHITEIKEDYVKISPLKRKWLLFRKKPLPTTKTINEHDIVIDRYAYLQITKILRHINSFRENNDVPKNRMAREIMIEEAREKLEEQKSNNEFKSQLLPLASFLSVEMGILAKDLCEIGVYELMYDVQRLQKIKNAQLLMTSGYSGFGIDLKKIDKKELNYLSDISI